MTGIRMSRRRLGRLVAALLPAIPRFARGQSFDQGIGGTGVVGDPKDESSDQMIGGTGVVGTIRRFGSIYVNGLRITYPDNLPVMRDGARVTAKSLKLGHVVRVGTMRAAGPGLAARSIALVHEVVGPVDAVASDSATVLGQTVSLRDVEAMPSLAVGQVVAVSGLRRLDGTIVASLIEAAPPGEVRVAGPLTLSPAGVPTIGSLPIARVDRALIGHRVTLVGQRIQSTLLVKEATADRAALAGLGTARWSVEAYVAEDAAGLRLGSGLQVDSAVAASSEEELAVVTVELGPRHRLVVQAIRPEAPFQPSSQPTLTKKDDTKRSIGRSSGAHGGHGRR